MFTFQNVTYKNILKIPDLTIKESSITCLVGESGTGKSTLLKFMNHMLSPSSGTVTYKDTPITDIDPIELRRDVSMLSQTPVLFGETVKDNVEAGLLFANKPFVDETTLQEAIHYFYLKKPLDEKADTLSGGEQQRLALARMKVLDSPVFLLDEPTSALDEDLEHDVMERFIEYARNQDKTVIFVTHAKTIAKAFADEIIDITPFSLKGSAADER
ncbi:putative ABC transport system ATP-binding protein [Alteribacillus persepolensis]|uniref:Putative ABC transport system ATP-binding protein n=1 Tax=Alteribacillus persepolensis TaxID=568899 RepID=A0A1G8FNZ5_9BACI|nr:ABC transporter ATP-binding protein [Alteribacillus persepolensis]SDH83882.1 putative ABC transport system ATP-binding protein [Alteribacillus persepolensis]